VCVLLSITSGPTEPVFERHRGTRWIWKGHTHWKCNCTARSRANTGLRRQWITVHSSSALLSKGMPIYEVTSNESRDEDEQRGCVWLKWKKAILLLNDEIPQSASYHFCLGDLDATSPLGGGLPLASFETPWWLVQPPGTAGAAPSTFSVANPPAPWRPRGPLDTILLLSRSAMPVFELNSSARWGVQMDVKLTALRSTFYGLKPDCRTELSARFTVPDCYTSGAVRVGRSESPRNQTPIIAR